MPSGFHPLRVVAVAAETADAVTVTFEPEPARRSAFAFAPGQHIVLHATIDGEDVRRNYSLCSAPSSDRLRVAIKKVNGGRFSQWAHAMLKPGATIASMTPRGHFSWTFDPSARRDYVAFAGGSGITPILSLLAAGLATEPDSRFTLLYGNRTSASIMFLEELADLKDRYMERLRIFHFLSGESDDIALFNGRLDAGRIEEALATLIDPEDIGVAFICGPEGMTAAAERTLSEAGVPADRILAERFTAGPAGPARTEEHERTARRAEGLPIEVTLDGRRRTVPFHAENGNILDSARAAGMPAPFACKAGVCATCRARLTSGKVDMAACYGLSREEIARGYILTCQAVPASDQVAIDFDG